MIFVFYNPDDILLLWDIDVGTGDESYGEQDQKGFPAFHISFDYHH